MDLLRCTLCYLNEGHPEPLYPHDHYEGRIPILPCPECFLDRHGNCQPIAPWWCNCSHRDCWHRMEAP